MERGRLSPRQRCAADLALRASSAGLLIGTAAVGLHLSCRCCLATPMFRMQNTLLLPASLTHRIPFCDSSGCFTNSFAMLVRM